MRATNDPKLTGRVAAAMLATVALGGCITVNAPDEPIVIELNVNIRQEVKLLLFYILQEGDPKPKLQLSWFLKDCMEQKFLKICYSKFQFFFYFYLILWLSQ